MDPSGKLIYTRNQEVLSSNLQTIQDESIAEGSRIPLTTKEIATTEILATPLFHYPNERFVTVVGLLSLRTYMSGYSLSLSIVEYQTAILRNDVDAAAEILPTIPKDQLNKVARFLESRGDPLSQFPIFLR